MEPAHQFEIQLGHMCNNRCVFCVSGQRTAMREAMPIEATPLIERMREARGRGATRVTILGGEPTLQPDFLDVVRAGVDLGFAEIVIFTNGVKTSRGSFVDEVLATGAKITWRLSFQGGNALAHERTTKKLGSFARLRETLDNLRDRTQPITVNMCVVQSNFASVSDFPGLLGPYGVRQLHLDMVRPLDAGVRTEDEFRGMIPRYADLVAPLEKLIVGLPDGFDVNVGNLPYCIAPQLTPWIHHDGQATETVSIDHRADVSEAWDKYEVKRRDKIKIASCAECVMNDRCSGVFEMYAQFYGTDELVPLRTAPLREASLPFARFALSLGRRLGDGARIDAMLGRIEVSLPEGARLALTPPGEGVASTDRCALQFLAVSPDARDAVERWWGALNEGATVRHPLGDDAFVPVDPQLLRALRALRREAPFAGVTWRATRCASAMDAEIELADGSGGLVCVELAVRDGRVSGRYRVVTVPGDPTALREGVRSVMDVLRGPSRTPGTPRDAHAVFAANK